MILALDSAASVGSVALVEDGQAVRERSVDTPRGRGGALFSTLEDVLRDAPPVSGVVVGTGPGSYNGIRSALAVGWGIARARKVSFWGISSLLALADGEYRAVGDARRGQFYGAWVKDGAFFQPPVLRSREELVAWLGDGCDVPVYVPTKVDFLPQAVETTASAVRLARLVKGREPDRIVPEPLYLKPAHITSAGKSVERGFSFLRRSWGGGTGS